MATHYSCRWPALAEVVALVDGAELADSTPCAEPARWATVVHRERDGQDIEATTRLCVPHDQVAQGLPGYVESTRLPTCHCCT